MQKNKNKMSIISEFIIFLALVLLSVITVNKFINSSDNISVIQNTDYLEDIEKENKAYKKDIINKYGINIIFGNENKNIASNVNSNMQNNANVINFNLKNISKELEKYPEDFFNIFKGKKYSLKIILVDSFNNNNLALTSKNSLNEYKIYISNTDKFSKAFHHEMYHVLEYYMCDTNKYIYKSWYKLNPEGFKYIADTELLNNEYVFSRLTAINDLDVDIYEDTDNPYFVTLYSKTTEREDRAEIFSEIMIAKSKPKYLNEGQNILNKAVYIDNAIKKCVTNNKFYYSKYIN